MKRGQKPIDPDAWKVRVAKREGIEWVSDEKSAHRGDYERALLFHTACGREFAITPNAFKRGRGCTLCGAESRGRTERREFNSFQELVDEVHGPGKYLVAGKFEKMADKIEIEHLASGGGCGSRFNPRGDNFTKRTGATTCPHCARGWTKEEFLAELASRPGGGEYELVGEYEGVGKRIPLRHVPCGELWSPLGTNLLYDGNRCPACSASRNSRISMAVEAALSSQLAPHGLGPVRERWFPGLLGQGGCPLRYDFGCDELRLLVEADGEFHDGKTNFDWDTEGRFAATAAHDRLKDAWPEPEGWSLLRVHHSDPDPASTVAAFLAPLLERLRRGGPFPPGPGGSGGRPSLVPREAAPRELRADRPRAGRGGPRPMSREELDSRLLAMGKGIVLDGPMAKSNETTSWRHLECGRTWETTPNLILNNKGRGTGCPHCKNVGGRPPTVPLGALIQEQPGTPVAAAPRHVDVAAERTISRMKERLGDGYRLVGPYEGYARPYRLVHLACGREWSPTVTNVMSGQRCPHCRERVLATAARPGTTRRIVDLASYALFCDKAEGCEPGEYVPSGWVDSRTKTPMLHRRCGRTYLVAPNLFQGGRRCPSCTPRGRAAAKARAEGRMGPPVNRETLKRLAKASPPG